MSESMKKIIDCLKDIVKANKGKEEIFYLSCALDPNYNNVHPRNTIRRVNNELGKIQAGFHLRYFDFTKVKIIVENTSHERG